MRSLALVVLIAVASLVYADPKPAELVTLLEQETSQDATFAEGVKLPRFVIGLHGARAAFDMRYDIAYDLPGETRATKPVVAFSADGKAAWIAADLAIVKPCRRVAWGESGEGSLHAQADYCDKKDPGAWLHAIALFERADQWQPVVWHVGGRAPGAKAEHGEIGEIDRGIEAGAEAAAKVFESTIGDPKALAKTISERDDVVMFGSERAERFTGGKAVAAKLVAWNLAFSVHDGVAAGVTSSKTVAWVAAIVDARPLKKPKAKPTSYRASFLFEKTADAWKVVQISFSAP